MSPNKQHRATPEQWAEQEIYSGIGGNVATCLLELRARVKALEAMYKPVGQTRARVKALEAMYKPVGQTLASRCQPLHVETTFADPSAPVDAIVRDVSLTPEQMSAIMAAQQPSHGTRLQSYSVGVAKPIEEWGKGHTPADPTPAVSPRLTPEDLGAYGCSDPIASKALKAGMTQAELIHHLLADRGEMLRQLFEAKVREAPKPVDVDGKTYVYRAPAAPAPADSLVERVAASLSDGLPPCDGTWTTEARAAIREVAAWLDERNLKAQNEDPDYYDEPTADDAVQWLRQQASQ